jgi:hypothetical protein
MKSFVFKNIIILSLFLIFSDCAFATFDVKLTEYGRGWKLTNGGEGFSYQWGEYSWPEIPGLDDGITQNKKRTIIFDCQGGSTCVSVDGEGYIHVRMPEGIEPVKIVHPYGVLPPEQIPEGDGVVEKDGLEIIP